MRKYVAAVLALLLTFASTSQAQLNLTYTSFQPGQSISAAQFTANFTAISANALNRTGGTMTGTLTLNGGTDVNGSFTIGSSNLQPFDSAGKIKEISSTYFASLSGANITGIPESAISDGSLLARVSSSETISGAWTFSTAPTMSGANVTSIPEGNITDGTILARLTANETVSGAWKFTSFPTFENVSPLIIFSETGVSANEGIWRIVVDGETFNIQTINDASTVTSSVLSVSRTGTTVGTTTLSGTNVSLVGATAVTGTLSSSGLFNASAGVSTTTLTTSGAATIGGNLTVSGTLTAAISGTFADGSVAAPGIRFTNDTDLGFYRSAADTITLVSGGLARMTFSSAGISGVADIRPLFDNNFELGSSSLRWQYVFLNNSPDVSSDRRLKQDITPVGLGIEFIDKLQPKAYRYVQSPTILHYGFIAQDLKELQFAGVSEGEYLGLRYEELIAPMVKGMQELHKEIHILETQNKMLQDQVETLAKRVLALEKGRMAIE